MHKIGNKGTFYSGEKGTKKIGVDIISVKPLLKRWSLTRRAVRGVCRLVFRPEHSIRNILSRDFVFGFLALFTFLSTVYILVPTLPIYLVRLGSSVREIGVLVGVFGASSLIFRLLVGGTLRRYSEKTVMMAGALLFTVAFFACLVELPLSNRTLF